MTEPALPDALPTRRSLLVRSAAVGGTLLWAAPVVQTLSVGVADAASVDGVGPLDEEDPVVVTPVVPLVPAHGLFVARLVITTPAGSAVGLPTVETVEYAYRVSSKAVVEEPSADDRAHLTAFPGAITSGGPDTPWADYLARVVTVNLGTQDPPAPRISVVLPVLPRTVSTMPLAQDYVPASTGQPARYQDTVAAAGVTAAFRGY